MADGPRFYKVTSKFWQDESVLGWSDDAKLLALYLLTCPHRTMVGYFVLPKPYICADLGWTPERLAEPFRELLANGFADYDDEARVILIHRALKYDAPENPNQLKAALRQVEAVPRSRLLPGLMAAAERFSERLAEGLRERFGEGLAEGYGKPAAVAVAVTAAAAEGSANPSAASPDADAAARASHSTRDPEQAEAHQVMASVVGIGTDPDTARELIETHGAEVVRRQLRNPKVQRAKNPSGALVRACRQGWAYPPHDQPRPQPGSDRLPDDQAEAIARQRWPEKFEGEGGLVPTDEGGSQKPGESKTRGGRAEGQGGSG